jgi:hypothetical protein
MATLFPKRQIETCQSSHRIQEFSPIPNDSGKAEFSTFWWNSAPELTGFLVQSLGRVENFPQNAQ